jgi:hypothetical protein
VTRDKEVEEEAMRAEQDKLKLRHTFSKVVRKVTSYSRYSRALTFENVLLVATLLQLLPRRSDQGTH